MDLHTIGIDLGKTVFHLVGLDLRGEVVVRKKFSRKQLLHFTANLSGSDPAEFFACNAVNLARPDPRVRQPSSSLSSNSCGCVFEFGDQFLELGIPAKALKIIVGRQSIGIFIPALDGFMEILKRFIRMAGCDGHTGKRIPHRETVSLRLGTFLLFDKVAK